MRSTRFTLIISSIVLAVAVIFFLRNQRSNQLAPASVQPGSAPAPAAVSESRDDESIDPTVKSTMDQAASTALEPKSYSAELTKHPYEAIVASTLTARVRSIPIRNGELVNPDQQESFYRSLEETIWAYKVGSADLILAARYCAPYEILPGTLEKFRAALKGMTAVPEAQWPTDAEPFLEFYARNYNFGEDGSGFKDFYNELSPDASFITFHDAKEAPLGIWKGIDHDMQLGGPRVSKSREPHLSYRYVNTPEAELSKQQHLLYADATIAATDANDFPFYRIKRFYWSSADQKWLPWAVLDVEPPPKFLVEFY